MGDGIAAIRPAGLCVRSARGMLARGIASVRACERMRLVGWAEDRSAHGRRQTDLVFCAGGGGGRASGF